MTEIGPNLTPSITQRIAHGSFWTVLGTGSGRVMNLIAMVLAARLLGAEGFGAFALVQSTLGLFGMLAGAALGATATRFIAATYRTDPERTGRIIGLVNGSALLSVVFFGAIIFAIAPWLARIVLGSADLALASALGAFLVGLGVLRGVQDATLAGFEAFRKISLLRFIEGGSSLLLIPLLVPQLGPAGGIAALSLGHLLAFLPGIGFVKGELNDHNVSQRFNGAIREWRLLRDFSAPSLLSSIIATPVLWLCALLLSRTTGGFAELGLYNGAYQWHGPLVFIPTAIASVSLPILTQAWSAGDYIAFRRLFLRVLALGTIVALAPALLAAMLSPQIMGLYGEEFRSAGTVLVLLTLAAPLHVASKIATSAIQSMNLTWYLPIFNGIWGGMLIILAILTIGSLGAEGLALALITSYLALALVLAWFVIWFSSPQRT